MPPIDLTSATRAAVFRALSQGVDPATCPVFDAVPQDTQPRYLRVGVIESDPEGKAPQVERMTVEVLAIYRGDERGKLSAMLHAGRVALTAAAITAPGVKFSVPRWLGNTVGLALQQDGVTYAALSHYEIWAEPA